MPRYPSARPLSEALCAARRYADSNHEEILGLETPAVLKVGERA